MRRGRLLLVTLLLGAGACRATEDPNGAPRPAATPAPEAAAASPGATAEPSVAAPAPPAPSSAIPSEFHGEARTQLQQMEQALKEIEAISTSTEGKISSL